jgi:uncharacterized protein
MNWKKIGLFILISFGFSWLIALVMKIAGVEYGKTVATVLIGTLYMIGPAIATLVVQRFIYKQGFKEYGWTFDKKKVKWLLRIPILFLLIVTLTFAVIMLFGNTQLIPQFGRLDFSQESFNAHFNEMLKDKIDVSKIKLPEVPAVLFFIVSLIQGVIIGGIVNIPFMFGEEFGWRGLFLKETQQLGFLKSNVFIGLIWGLWHAPLILMGHNYPNHPYFGVLMMCFFTIALAPVFAYIRLKTKTILGPCILHGMINATATLFTLYVSNFNELCSSIAGWAGVLACTIFIVGIYVFDREFVRGYENE